MRAALKVTPILLCWPKISEVGGGGVAVEVELSNQYPVACCCYVPDGSMRAV